MKNKKGFTLIELLAVIVILAVVALIATPTVLNVVKNAREKAKTASAYGILDAANLYYAEHYIEDDSMFNGKINLLNKLHIKGKRPEDGYVFINEVGKVKLSLYYVDKAFKKDYNKSNLVEVTDKEEIVSVLSEIESKVSNLKNGIMLDVARRYYTVSEIKKFIDILSKQDKSFLQLHLTDDENVGVECKFLDQTKETATVSNGIYTNPNTNNKFLTYDQINEILNYAKSKSVEVVPEIDIPAHMTSFFTLARLKFGDEYVNKFAKGKGDEAGNIDIVTVEGKNFIKSIYDEYTALFKNSKYFHIGFDEYTYRIDEKADYINEIATYLINKGFIVRMWNDPITESNYNQINKNIEITYWDYAINKTELATVNELQEAGFKILNANSAYLFLVPNTSNINDHDLSFTVNDIKNNWTINLWNSDNHSTIKNYNNLIGSFISVWGEESSGVDSNTIIKQSENMYNAMVDKNTQIDN